MTPKQKAQLMEDLRTRREIRIAIAENARHIVSMELGLSITTVWHAENGIAQARPGTGVTPEIAREIQRRRAIWELEHERGQEYTLEALAERYGLSVNTVCKYARKVRAEQQALMRFERDAA